METWYRCRGSRSENIEAVTVLKATAKQVTFLEKDWGEKKERKASITSEYMQFFRTWEEAHSYLVTSNEQRIKSIRVNLDRANGHLGNIRGMKKPE